MSDSFSNTSIIESNCLPAYAVYLLLIEADVVVVGVCSFRILTYGLCLSSSADREIVFLIALKVLLIRTRTELEHVPYNTQFTTFIFRDMNIVSDDNLTKTMNPKTQKAHGVPNMFFWCDQMLLSVDDSYFVRTGVAVTWLGWFGWLYFLTIDFIARPYWKRDKKTNWKNDTKTKVNSSV